MMIKCKCIVEDPIRGLIKDCYYFTDTDSFYKDCDGDLLTEIYPVNLAEKNCICFSFYNKHFVPKIDINNIKDIL